jgi:CHASE2 domain-containing protein
MPRRNAHQRGSPPPEPPTISRTTARETADWWKEVLKGLVIGPVVILIDALYHAFIDRTMAQPYEILWIVLPLIFVAILTWKIARRTALHKVHWAWPAFFATYCIIFTLLAASDVLVWKRTPFPQPEAGRGWLLPVWLGDWRYKVVPREAASKDVIVVLLDEPRDRNLNLLRESKREMLELAKSAGRVQGLAFDFYFEGNSDLDDLFCENIRAAGFPVFSGYTTVSNTDLSIRPHVDALSKCMPLETQLGYLAGWADVDSTVRTIPLYYRDQRNRPTLSVRIAERMAPVWNEKIEIPDAQLLRFVEPDEPIPVYGYAEVEANPALLSDTFILVGEKGSADSFRTPFGPTQGSLIHAMALHSLRTHSYITRAPDGMSGLVIFVACYTLVLLAAIGASTERLVITAIVISGAVFLLSLAAIMLWRVWIEIIYAWVACWLLLPMILALRKTVPALSARSPAHAA